MNIGLDSSQRTATHIAAGRTTDVLVGERVIADSYRADIDGLRAIAILSVVAFHAFPDLLRGGFVGVDVFFVISGFLISGIILRALRQDGFSFIDFYARRIRRIFPALILVLLSAWALGWLKMLPDEYASLTKHIAAGSVYASNLLLFKESGYFDLRGQLKPLLHLWSLGVEEQFYLAWPLLLFLSYYARRTQLLAMIGLACVSFFINVWTVKGHAVAAFYMPQARLWELAVGGILAHIALTRESRAAPLSDSAPTRMHEAAAVLGVVLLCAAFVLFDSRLLFPGWPALIPVLGTILLIAAGERAWINQHLLACRPLVFIGLISYPLYLWHWPLISILRIVGSGELRPFMALGAVAVAFLLAVLTYQYVELPIRRIPSLSRTATALFACLGVVGCFGYVAYRQQAAPLSARYGIAALIPARTEHAFDGAHLRRVEGVWVQGTGPRTILFMGDSYMEQYYPRIDELLNHDSKKRNTVAFATSGGCPPVPGVIEARHTYCNGLIKRAVAYADRHAVDAVVIGADWDSYFSHPDPRWSYYFQDKGFRGELLPGAEAQHRALESFAALIKHLVSRRLQVYIVLQIPVGDSLDPRHMVQRSLTTFQFSIDRQPLNRSTVAEAVAGIDSQLKSIAQANGALTIDPMDTLCDPAQCPTFDPAGHPMYTDGGHLRNAYVRLDVHYLDDIMNPPALN